MDPTSLLIAAGIVVYGILEYRRREMKHTRNLVEVRKGLQPVFGEPRVCLWQVLTTGAVLILLLAFIIVLLWLEFRTGMKVGPYVPVAAFFGIFFLIVFLMLIRVLLGYIRWRARP